MADPYRDNLESQIRRNEQGVVDCNARLEESQKELKGDVSRLEKRINDAKLVPSIWGSIKSAFYNFTHWNEWGEGGGFVLACIIGITVILAFGVPACVQSCDADQQHSRELTARQHEESCQAMGLSFMDYSNGYIVCSGAERVVYVNPGHPELSYSRTVEQLQEATLPE